jgi:hypothetical protein
MCVRAWRLRTHMCTSNNVWRCIQKFPDWPPGARTANGTALCHKVQLYRYFVSQCNEFCSHNPLWCFSKNVYCCKRIFLYRLSPETFGYTLVCMQVAQIRVGQLLHSASVKTYFCFHRDVSFGYLFCLCISHVNQIITHKSFVIIHGHQRFTS